MNEFVEKHKIYLIAAALAVLLVGGYWYFILGSQNQKIFTLTNEIEGQKTKIEQLNKRLAKLTKLEKEIKKLIARQKQVKKEVAKVEKELPKTRDPEKLLNNMDKLAKATSLNMKAWIPGGGELPGLRDKDNKPIYKKKRYNIEIEGNYHSLAKFLNGLGTFDRIINEYGFNIRKMIRHSKKKTEEKKEPVTMAVTFKATNFFYTGEEKSK